MNQPRDRPAKDRKFMVELYSETESYNISEVLEAVRRQPAFAYCLHDKDADDDGCLKKAHYHVFLRYSSPYGIETIANKLGIPSQFVQVSRKARLSARYLMHLDHPEKYQYSLSEVVTNIPDFQRFVGLLHEGSIMADIFDEIDSGELNPFQILKERFSDASTYSVCRRNWSIIQGYCEHRRSNKLMYASRVDMDTVTKLLNEMRVNKNENS